MKKLLSLLALSTLVSCQTNELKQSAASQRHIGDDSQNEFFSTFRYRPLKGLGYEPGIGRRDPSNILKVGDTFYIWYTRIEGDKPTHDKSNRGDGPARRFKWDLAEVWYASSKNGIDWMERGACVKPGPKGAFDDRSVFTPNILQAGDKFYLCYQAVMAPYTQRIKNVVAMAVADNPNGPWRKLDKPILETGKGGKWIGDEFELRSQKGRHWTEASELGEWDSMKVHDPQILYRNGKYCLYYKGQQVGRHPFDSKWGVAFADHPQGPYVKSPLNPISNSGHEIWVWPYKSGVAGIIDWAGPEKNTLQYSEDGVNFEIKSALLDIPPAGGVYCPDMHTDPKDGQGFNWGIAHIKSDWDYLVHFSCDLKQGQKKNFNHRYNTYNKTLGVSDNPKWFQPTKK